MGFLDWIFGTSTQPKHQSQSNNNYNLSESKPKQNWIAQQKINGMEITDEFRAAFTAMDTLYSPIYITGNAGTGKSTLLKIYRDKVLENKTKNIVVVAPTGMAALNVRGKTIHSFFHFPPKLLSDKDIRINHQRIDMIKSLDMIIIDEVSMVRADLLDAIDNSLKLHRANGAPFGGVQIVMFGDICQLPPVVKGNILEDYFSTYYDTPYFFSSHALKRTGLTVIELTNVFRQKDTNFVELLNRIRKNSSSIEDMIVINERYTEAAAEQNDNLITLTATNKTADQINNDQLDRLPGPEFNSNAIMQGQYIKDAYPAPEHLKLKKNARIMMRTNAGRFWVNGTLGKLIGWDNETVRVALPSGKHEIERETWESLEYYYDKEEKRIKEEVVGTFTQFPVIPAWAITIHKSQGQTFEKIAIDLNKGAFAHGQLYVALSRCKSLQGINLYSPVALPDICFDERVKWFIERTKIGGHISLEVKSSSKGKSQIPTSYSVSEMFIKSDQQGTKAAIINAMTTNSQITIKYSDYYGRESERTITPTTWIDSDIFSAFCHLRSEERHFRITRISSFIS